MVARITFGLIAAFWVTMNVLLWRAEYGPRDPAGSAVPVTVVWRKILNAPDSSSLSIWRRGERIGFCHWVTSVAEEFATLDEAPPEGMMGKVKHYRIKLDGSVTIPDTAGRLHFDCVLKLSTNRTWQEFNLRLGVRPASWELRVDQAAQSVRLHGEDGESQFDRTFKFSELQSPQAVLKELAGPDSFGFLGGLGLPALPQTATAPSAALRWEGRLDTVRIGHEPVQVYRLKTRLLERYDAAVFVSRAGEILRADLPGGILLAHDQLTEF